MQMCKKTYIHAQDLSCNLVITQVQGDNTKCLLYSDQYIENSLLHRNNFFYLKIIFY